MSDASDTRDNFVVTLDGVKLRTRSLGDPALPSILFLHGGGGTLEDFDALAPRFTDHRCVLYDARGHGGSTLGNRELSYPLLAEDAEAVISNYGLNGPLVVGHSDGGITALHLALRKRHRLMAIVTIGADAEPPGTETLALFEAMTPDKWRAKFPDGVELYDKLSPDGDFDRFFTALRMMWMEASEGNYPSSEVSAIDVPTLVLGGDRDHLAPPAGQLSLAQAIPEAHLGVVPFAGHMVHQEKPIHVEQLIRNLLDRLQYSMRHKKTLQVPR